MNAMTASVVRIEQGIPLPPRAGNSAKYPFAQMSIGDSFFLNETAPKVRAAVEYFRKSNPTFKASVRKDASGIRCWRTA